MSIPQVYLRFKNACSKYSRHETHCTQRNQLASWFRKRCIPSLWVRKQHRHCAKTPCTSENTLTKVGYLHISTKLEQPTQELPKRESPLITELRHQATNFHGEHDLGPRKGWAETQEQHATQVSPAARSCSTSASLKSLLPRIGLYQPNPGTRHPFRSASSTGANLVLKQQVTTLLHLLFP